jgi:hypothetical protein
LRAGGAETGDEQGGGAARLPEHLRVGARVVHEGRRHRQPQRHPDRHEQDHGDGSALASIDATVVGIALPAIGRDFGVGLAALQWVVTAYTLTLAGLLLIVGSLGDKYGRKKIFQIGVIWFALASARCGVAPSAGALIAARALQGVGAALGSPWLDLSRDRRAVPGLVRREVMLSPGWLEACALAYAPCADWAAPSVSPLLAAHGGLPPLLIQAGSDEVLAPDAERLAVSASAAGADVTYTRWPGMWHDFVLQPGLVAAADSALTQSAWFVLAVTAL